jgi:DNA invertase Pin-like site-specific DNA recombinase
VIRAAIYVCISSDRDGDELGVRRQIVDCEDLAERKRWTVVDRYVDNDVSAYSGRARPEYRRMLEDTAAGLIDAIVVWHLDRLHRQPKELEEFFEAVDAAGVTRLATVTGDVDLATHDGRFMARILGAVSRKESDDKSRRVTRKHEELAQQGRSTGGGDRPYGFEADRLTIRESEATIIRECARRFLAGDAIRGICADLDARGVRSVSGKPWRPQTMARMLKSARISGQREHRGVIVADAQWPAIITPAETTRIRAIFSDPSRRTNRAARRYLLVRLLRCGLCGETLVSRPNGDGIRRYICARGVGFSGCGHLFIKADELELFIVEAILHRLDSPELAAAMNGGRGDPDAERIQVELDEATAHLAELARAYGERTITLAEWLAAREPIERRMATAKRQLARLGRVSVVEGHVGHASALRKTWPDLPLTSQRSIVAAVLDHAIVGPGRRGYNRFDETRLTPVWRV